MRQLLLALLIASTAAQAQSWPSRPVTLIVPSAPGGLADATARPFALAMGKLAGQNFIVDNKPGAGGARVVTFANGVVGIVEPSRASVRAEYGTLSYRM